MDKLKYIKIQNEDGSYSGVIPVGADAANIDFSDGNTLEEVIENIYTKAEVNNLLGNISSLKIEIVSTLPTSSIDTNTIYLKPATDSKTNNIYEEYMYVNSKWEMIGTTAIDLSNYYTKSEVEALITNAVGNALEASY